MRLKIAIAKVAGCLNGIVWCYLRQKLAVVAYKGIQHSMWLAHFITPLLQPDSYTLAQTARIVGNIPLHALPARTLVSPSP
jgi:hypothetical protein